MRFLGIMGRKMECVWVGVYVRVITAEKRLFVKNEI